MTKRTVISMRFYFLGDKEEAERKALRLIHREIKAGRIVAGIIEKVGGTYEVEEN
jgi:hypothetical protein